MTRFQQLEFLLKESEGMLLTSQAVARGISKPTFNNLSNKNAADAQILIRNYMIEQFLERI